MRSALGAQRGACKGLALRSPERCAGLLRAIGIQMGCGIGFGIGNQSLRLEFARVSGSRFADIGDDFAEVRVSRCAFGARCGGREAFAFSIGAGRSFLSVLCL